MQFAGEGPSFGFLYFEQPAGYGAQPRGVAAQFLLRVPAVRDVHDRAVHDVVLFDYRANQYVDPSDLVFQIQPVLDFILAFLLVR
jgi:hypothetical protein